MKYNMKKILMLFIAVALSLSVSAKSMREVWISMPDSIIPYLDKNLRMELIDFIDMKVKAEVKNKLDENTVIDVFTDNYVSIRLNGSSQMQIKLLPSKVGDSLLCMVRTFNGPEQESEIEFYSQGWKRLDSYNIDLNKFIPSMVVKPDTMSQSKFDELREKMYPVMVNATLLQNEDYLILQLTSPILFKDEKMQLKPILLQRKLKWNSERFN